MIILRRKKSPVSLLELGIFYDVIKVIIQRKENLLIQNENYFDIR
jgi:hypothetical protein